MTEQIRFSGVSDFRVFGCQYYADATMEDADDKVV